jgi:hypothetical protein
MLHIVTAEDLLSHAVLIEADGRAAAFTICRKRRLTDFMRRGEHRGWPLFLADPRKRCPACSKLIAALGNQLAAAQARAVTISGDD